MRAAQSSAQARSWRCEPWPQLLMAGPFAAMIGRSVTIWLAVLHPDVAIHGNIMRHSLAVEKTTVTPTHGVHAGAR